MKNYVYLMTTLVILGLTACQFFTPQQNSVDCNQLIRAKIQEYFVPELENAEFLRRPTLIIKGKLAETMDTIGQIDPLTSKIRREIIKELMGRPGYYIIQRHRIIPPETPGVKPKNICNEYSTPENYLIIDTQYSKKNKHATVTIFGASLETPNKNLPGFGVSFSLDLKSCADELNNSQAMPDDYLMGTRYVPFKSEQKDRIAKYLAQSIICRIKIDPDFLRDASFIISGEKNCSSYQYDIIKILRQYLIKYGIKIVDQSNHAKYNITFSTISITNKINVAWIVIKQNGQAKITTEVYYFKPKNEYSACNILEKWYITDTIVRMDKKDFHDHTQCCPKNNYYFFRYLFDISNENSDVQSNKLNFNFCGKIDKTNNNWLYIASLNSLPENILQAKGIKNIVNILRYQKNIEICSSCEASDKL